MSEHLKPHDDGVLDFQSDKYPTTPVGKVPLSTKDPMAQDLLWEYAQRRRSVDAEFADDLETALVNRGYQPRGIMAKEMSVQATVSIEYEFEEGCHVFTSDDVDGLLVVSKDPETAFKDVAPAIEMLFKLNEKVEVRATPMATLSEFLRATKDGERAERASHSITRQRDFAVALI